LLQQLPLSKKVNTTNARSTVGTSTEIYDYMKLLFARIGRTYSPFGQEVKKIALLTWLLM
jgi:excinuclease ABC subunit A